MTPTSAEITVVELDVRALAERIDAGASKVDKEAKLLLGTAAMHISAAAWLIGTVS